MEDVADLTDVAGEVEPDAAAREFAGELVEHAGRGDVDERAALAVEQMRRGGGRDPMRLVCSVLV
jgi:hypothetical protein